MSTIPSRFHSRAWDISKKKMYYRGTCITPDGWVSRDREDDDEPNDVGFISLGMGDHGEDCYFMQSTGLLDKNGKEIFEGDIISSRSGWWVGEVIFGDKQHFLSVKTTSSQNVKLRCGKQWTIFGNIFENPNLLKK